MEVAKERGLEGAGLLELEESFTEVVDQGNLTEGRDSAERTFAPIVAE